MLPMVRIIMNKFCKLIRILKRYFTAMSDIRFLHRASGASRKTGVGFMHPLRGFQDFVIEMLSHNPFPPHFFLLGVPHLRFDEYVYSLVITERS
jgi:hypothetical protein